MKMNGAEIMMECLVREGVDTMFGYPGGAIMPVHDAMLKYPVHHVLTRHEQGASHAADGYARASGKVGVAIATSGPGATNLVTGIVTAMMDSVPIVCITGQVPAHLIGGDAFQETDVTGVTLPITKHNYLITRVDEIATVVREAFHIARSGRPGPVLIDFCKNAQLDEIEFEYPEDISLPGYSPPDHAPMDDLKKAVELIEEAERPVILAGHGVSMSGAMEELRIFATKTNTPVSMTLLGLGALPASDPLSLGMMGMHGEAYANEAIQNADLILAFGMRFDDRVTGVLAKYAPDAKKIHVEVDPTEVHKNVTVDVPLMGDLKTVLTDMIPLLDEYDHPQWMEQIAEWKSETEERSIMSWQDDGKLYSAHAIRAMWTATEGDALVVTGVGQHQMWAAQYYEFEKPYRLLTSGGAGTMGYGLPAALGAWFTDKEKDVWLIDGDGSFQMTQAELSTMVQEGASVKIVLLNNSYLGMVRQWQELFFDERYAATPITGPDFIKIAEAHGIPAKRVTKPEEAMDALEFAKNTPGTVLIEFQVEKDELVYPMVPAGAALNEMLRRPVKGKK
ncbi:MAG: biosynthetic-type acetolactate synthase large subunit [Anaerolineae bacterium]|jgi:acetolactate synthase-1/2/3 large subunit|nr:biosynthetic-type acetolactate synthase large subunit [Anaerolineae bacterium]MBT4309007.1 biosynthetic-type acetolactate synthase large subunit [Anaerolineae bacterium]MBT4459348.1 biosynthetic-type acetolactate synthase large subunit [Anaerolineae bacterium]MBT6062272.1 biosynthetic-type acetolactate synthase large subunit [Anaerolineae bacterium]MBT6320911.1 biosynthetic-type acetolactate synthase large subunit [Anaerolineae bacterium]